MLLTEIRVNWHSAPRMQYDLNTKGEVNTVAPRMQMCKLKFVLYKSSRFSESDSPSGNVSWRYNAKMKETMECWILFKFKKKKKNVD